MPAALEEKTLLSKSGHSGSLRDIAAAVPGVSFLAKKTP
jgi:hypothetical protein